MSTNQRKKSKSSIEENYDGQLSLHISQLVDSKTYKIYPNKILLGSHLHEKYSGVPSILENEPNNDDSLPRESRAPSLPTIQPIVELKSENSGSKDLSPFFHARTYSQSGSGNGGDKNFLSVECALHKEARSSSLCVRHVIFLVIFEASSV